MNGLPVSEFWLCQILFRKHRFYLFHKLAAILLSRNLLFLAVFLVSVLTLYEFAITAKLLLCHQIPLQFPKLSSMLECDGGPKRLLSFEAYDFVVQRSLV